MHNMEMQMNAAKTSTTKQERAAHRRLKLFGLLPQAAQDILWLRIAREAEINRAWDETARVIQEAR